MPLTADLINIDSLVLSDTFQTWVNRTNQIIDDLNPLQVYDVEVGTTGGLLKETGMSAGNYNGVVTLSLNPGPGVGTWTLGGASRAVVDFSRFGTYSLELTGGASGAASAVAGTDEFIINDISDTQQSGSGTAKKVQARNMLPYEIAGDHRFSSNITIGGNLIVQGSDTFIAANNLRIEDKQIELAYQQAIALTLTGVTGGTFKSTSFGATAYHFVTSTGLTPDMYGHLDTYTGAAAGPTGRFTIGSLFQDPYDADNFVGITGYISLGSTGNPRYLVVGAGTPFNSFLNDEELSQGGIVLKGASGDKSFLWLDSDTSLVYNYENTWAALTSNIGVASPLNSVVSSNYRSVYVIDSDDDVFRFMSFDNAYGVKLLMGSAPWTLTSSSQYGSSVGFYRPATTYQLAIVSSTGGNAPFTTHATLMPNISQAGGVTGSTWRVLQGITATNFFYQLNVDQLDGAHGSTSAAAYTIPIASEYGTIDETWLEASSIRRRVTQASHGLTMGDVVRVNSSGSYVKAIATSPQLGEAIGMVSSVSGNSFVVTLKGKISGLSGAVQTVEAAAYTPGEVYFLSGSTAGKLISDPDNAVLTRIPAGGVRKPMFLPTSTTEGYVLGYVGSVVTEHTDELYLDGLVPLGTIYPYAASSSYITEEWLICDGSRYTRAAYPDLYTITYNLYYANVVIANAGDDYGTIEGGIRNLAIGDVVTVRYNGTDYDREITDLNESTDYVQFDTGLPYAATYEMRVTEDSNGNEVFFIPDLRAKFIRGKGTSQNAGTIGGADTVTLDIGNLPSHSHGLDIQSTDAQAGSGLGLVKDGSTNDTTTSLTGGGEAVDIVPSYVALYYIIRAKHKTKATILTGHDHDNRYIRFDATHDSSLGLTEGGRERFRRNASVAGYPLGSSLTAFGPTHDHDLRYVRFDDTQTLTDSQEYKARTNINAAAAGEGDGYPQNSSSTAHNHDYIYPRFDGQAQSAFDDYPSIKSAFRTKLGVYSTTEMDDRYVNVSGDTMRGNLTMSSANIIITNGMLQADTSFKMNGSDSSNPFIEANSTSKYAIFDINNTYSSYFIVESSDLDNSTNGRTRKDILYIYREPNPSGNNSNCEVQVYGDFTVWGDGQTTQGYAGISNPLSQVGAFGVDPHLGRVFVGGRQPRTDSSLVAGPEINLIEGNDYITPSTHGKITGLTFPTETHAAANKAYVDKQTALFKYWAIGSGSDGITAANGLYYPVSNNTSLGIDAVNPITRNNVTLPTGYWHFTLIYSFINADNADCDIVFTVNGDTVRTHVQGPGANNRTLSGSITLLTNITSTFNISVSVSGTDAQMDWTHAEINATKVGDVYTV
jgi:hypothetical protein